MSTTRGWRHNESVSVLPSAARTAGVASADLDNWNARGLHLIVDVTSVGITDEVQSVTVDATGGTFTLTFDGQTTTALDFDITAEDLEAALEALSNIGAGDVSVTGGPGDDGGTVPYVVTFGGTLADTNVAQMTSDAALLTGGAGTAVVATTTAGGAAIAPALTVTIQGKDPQSGKYYTLLASAAITTVSTTVLKVYPGLAAAANASVSDVLPQKWRVSVAAGDSDMATYSIAANLLL